MYTLTKYNDKNYAINLILNNMGLFNSFNSIYLFGSILNFSKPHNDIDILLIYSVYSEKVIKDIDIILSTLNEISKLQIDLTVLSSEEEQQIQFLKKQKLNYVKIR